MGNRESFRRREKKVGDAPDIPEITVTGASPLPAEARVFNLPGPIITYQPDQAESLSPEAEQIYSHSSQVP